MSRFHASPKPEIYLRPDNPSADSAGPDISLSLSGPGRSRLDEENHGDLRTQWKR